MILRTHASGSNIKRTPKPCRPLAAVFNSSKLSLLIEVLRIFHRARSGCRFLDSALPFEMIVHTLMPGCPSERYIHKNTGRKAAVLSLRAMAPTMVILLLELFSYRPVYPEDLAFVRSELEVCHWILPQESWIPWEGILPFWILFPRNDLPSMHDTHWRNFSFLAGADLPVRGDL